MNLFKALLSKATCHHEWVNRHTTMLYEGQNTKRPYGKRRLYVCNKCGKMKKVNL